MNGLHILANFCCCKYLSELSEPELPDIVKNICIEAGLHVVGETHHLFPEKGITLVILLAESHLSIHTWPEKFEVAFDLYTCNTLIDNKNNTMQVYQRIIQLFGPQYIQEEIIKREQLKGQSRFYNA